MVVIIVIQQQRTLHIISLPCIHMYCLHRIKYLVPITQAFVFYSSRKLILRNLGMRPVLDSVWFSHIPMVSCMYMYNVEWNILTVFCLVIRIFLACCSVHCVFTLQVKAISPSLLVLSYVTHCSLLYQMTIILPQLRRCKL